jgi:uncharacterized Zn finger protein
VIISIKGIKQANWKELKNQCEGQLKSLQDLLAGKFPKTLADIFFSKEKGLFPSPKAISFDCSCPDWASMCKHVAATLYGIGARVDEDPSLFFKLRGVDTENLIAGAVKDKTRELLGKTKKKSARVLDDVDISDVFGIDMDIKPDFTSKRKVASPADRTKAQNRRTGAKKEGMPVKPPKDREKQRSKKTATGFVAELIAASKTGINIEKLVEKSGYPKTKLYGIVHRLKQQGKIKNKSHGVYVKV